MIIGLIRLSLLCLPYHSLHQHDSDRDANPMVKQFEEATVTARFVGIGGGGNDRQGEGPVACLYMVARMVEHIALWMYANPLSGHRISVDEVEQVLMLVATPPGGRDRDRQEQDGKGAGNKNRGDDDGAVDCSFEPVSMRNAYARLWPLVLREVVSGTFPLLVPVRGATRQPVPKFDKYAYLKEVQAAAKQSSSSKTNRATKKPKAPVVQPPLPVPVPVPVPVGGLASAMTVAVKDGWKSSQNRKEEKERRLRNRLDREEREAKEKEQREWEASLSSSLLSGSSPKKKKGKKKNKKKNKQNAAEGSSSQEDDSSQALVPGGKILDLSRMSSSPSAAAAAAAPSSPTTASSPSSLGSKSKDCGGRSNGGEGGDSGMMPSSTISDGTQLLEFSHRCIEEIFVAMAIHRRLVASKITPPDAAAAKGSVAGGGCGGGSSGSASGTDATVPNPMPVPKQLKQRALSRLVPSLLQSLRLPPSPVSLFGCGHNPGDVGGCARNSLVFPLLFQRLRRLRGRERKSKLHVAASLLGMAMVNVTKVANGEGAAIVSFAPDTHSDETLDEDNEEDEGTEADPNMSLGGVAAMALITQVRNERTNERIYGWMDWWWIDE
jgi:hypothetical protein